MDEQCNGNNLKHLKPSFFFLQLKQPVQSLTAHSIVLLVLTDKNTVPVTKALYLIPTTSPVTVH